MRWGLIEAISGIIVIGSIVGIVFTTAEPTGGGVYKMTERPPWLIYASMIVFVFAVLGVFAHMSRRNPGDSILVRLIQTILMILFLAGIVTVLSMFR